MHVGCPTASIIPAVNPEVSLVGSFFLIRAYQMPLILLNCLGIQYKLYDSTNIPEK